MQIKRAVLLLALLCSGCFGVVRNTWAEKNIPDYHGQYDGAWYTRNGLAHAAITAGAVGACDLLGIAPTPCAVAACAFYVGHEYEESNGFRRFQWGVMDSVGDMAAPCAVGFTLIRF